MSQNEIFKFFLKNKGKKFTNKELSKRSNIRETSVSNNTRKLSKAKMIKSDEIKIKHYKYNRYWV